MRHAYALLEVKAIDDDERVIEGIATTPTPDRAGDIMEPKGAQFTLPIPFLWQHDTRQPLGHVTAAKVTTDGITITARFVKTDEPGRLKERLDEAWQSVKLGLVRGLSIGWMPVEAAFNKETGGLHVLKWIWGELSAVTIPQNVEATILKVKELDLAASGRHSPGGPGPHPVVRAEKAAPAMSTVAEQLTNFANTRAAKSARMSTIMTAAAEKGETLDPAATEEYDTLEREVKAIDAHLVRLKALEASQAAGATPITAPTVETAGAQRGGTPTITVKSQLPKGTAFTRYAMALVACKGNKFEAAEYARQRWHDSSPEVELVLKAAVAAGNTTDASWAGPLAVMQPLATEFLELLRPATILGKIPNLRRVPFNTSVPAQTGGGTYAWVGQGAPKPVGKLDFATVTLGIAKAAGIIVLTEELVKVSQPSAEETVRQDMVAGMAQYLDAQFIDPAVAAVANVSPGSVTNGTTPLTTAGTTPDNARTDLKALVAAFVGAGVSTANAVFVMSEANAFALGSALNPLGQPLFPGAGATGGTIMGIPVIASQTAGTTVALIDARGILLADDGGLNIDVSREASLQMDSAPANPADATTVFVSLWQSNLVGLRAERWINWKRARLVSVKYLVATYA